MPANRKGDEFDDAIIQHCRQHYNLLIGDRMAERIKIEIGSAFPFEEEKNMVVKGRDYYKNCCCSR